MAFKMNKPIIKGTKKHSALLAEAEEMPTASQALIEAAQQFVLPVEQLDLDYGGEMDVRIPIDIPDVKKKEDEEDDEEEVVEEEEEEVDEEEEYPDLHELDEGKLGEEKKDTKKDTKKGTGDDKKAKRKEKINLGISKVREFLKKLKPRNPNLTSASEGESETNISTPTPPPPTPETKTEPEVKLEEMQDPYPKEELPETTLGGETPEYEYTQPQLAKDNPKYNNKVRKIEGVRVAGTEGNYKHESTGNKKFNEGYTYHTQTVDGVTTERWYYTNKNGNVYEVTDDEVPIGGLIMQQQAQEAEYNEQRKLNFFQKQKFKRDNPDYAPPGREKKSTEQEVETTEQTEIQEEKTTKKRSMGKQSDVVGTIDGAEVTNSDIGELRRIARSSQNFHEKMEAKKKLNRLQKN
jgi:hypothetical protein